VFTQAGHSVLRDAWNVYLRTCGREGWISAINTWDNQILTWGTGFAYRAVNRHIWPRIDETRSYLARLLPRRFSSSDGIRVDDEIRGDVPALEALIYVSEHDPYRLEILRAQFRTFCVSTLGIRPDHVEQSSQYISGDPDLIYFASRVAHWLPAWFRIPEDLERVLTISGGTNCNPAIFVAATMRVFSEKCVAHSGTHRVGGRLVLRESVGDRFNMIAKWANRISQFYQQRTNRENLRVDARVREIMPCLRAFEPPIFNVVRAVSQLPERALALSEGERYVDCGPPLLDAPALDVRELYSPYRLPPMNPARWFRGEE
jgi:hypothetical protein